MLLWSVGGAAPLDIKGDLPFWPKGKPLAGLVITLDPAGGMVTHDPDAEQNMLVAGELNHHLVGTGAEVHFTRFDGRGVTTDSVGSSRDAEVRRSVALNTKSHLMLTIDHSGTGPGVIVSGGSGSADAGALARAVNACLSEAVSKSSALRPSGEPSTSAPLLVATVTFPSGKAAERGRHRNEARALFDGIVCAWKTQHIAMDATRMSAFPGLKPVAVAQDNQTTDAAKGGVPEAVRAVAKQLWPLESAPGTVEQAQWLLDSYKARMLDDRTFFYFDVRVARSGPAWVLSGGTNYPLLRNVAEGLLKSVGLQDVRNDIELLPGQKLGEKRFGAIQVPMALTWGKPTEGDDVQTQVLLGERVYLLDESKDGCYLLIQGGDGYCGWVRSEAVQRMDAKEFARGDAAPSVTLLADVIVDGIRLPAGATLPVLPGKATESQSVALALPGSMRGADGKASVEVSAASVRPLRAQEKSAGLAAAHAAAEFLTTPYVFGGRSRLGLDCSGLTGISWATAGLTLPRDARQQILVGKMVGTPYYRPALQPGDLVFFCDESGKVYHVGISVGGDRFLHSSPPEVQLSSFDPADPLYTDEWTKAFAFARRPMQRMGAD